MWLLMVIRPSDGDVKSRTPWRSSTRVGYVPAPGFTLPLPRLGPHLIFILSSGQCSPPMGVPHKWTTLSALCSAQGFSSEWPAISNTHT